MSQVAHKGRRVRLSKSISVDSILFLSVALAAFFLSIEVAPYHVGGDQVHYSRAYEEIRGMSLLEAIEIYRSIIFSYEPIHFFVSWVLSNLGFEKVVSMAVLNALLAYLFARFLRTKTRSFPIILLIVISNHYMYAAFFTLEKLKVSLIFLLLFLNFRKGIFGVVAGVAHLQVTILFLIYFAAKKVSEFKLIGRNLVVNAAFIFRGAFATALLLGFGLFFREYAGLKADWYLNLDSVGNVMSIAPAFVVFLATILSTDQKIGLVVFFFSFLFFLIFMIGGDRVNMFAIFAFIYFSKYRGQSTLRGIVFLLSIICFSGYFGLKSYSYIINIIENGG